MLAKLVLINGVSVIFISAIGVWTVRSNVLLLFERIMDQYNIDPVGPTQEFMGKMTATLVGGGAVFLLIGLIVNTAVHRIWMGDLLRLHAAAQEIARGRYTEVSIRSTDEIGEFGEAINLMSRSLARMEQERRGLLIDVAHELRTPLTAIRGYLDAWQDGVMEPTQLNLTLLRSEVRRLQTLVESIHRLNTLEYQSDQFPREVVDFGQLMDEMWTLFEYKFEEAGIRYRFTGMGSSVLRLVGNRDLLVQMLYNILDNCLRYTAREELVDAALTVGVDGALSLQVRNSGASIAAIDPERAVQRFVRGEQSRSRRTGGIGVGLAIVKRVADMHAAQLTIESVSGAFAIHVVLPAHLVTIVDPV